MFGGNSSGSTTAHFCPASEQFRVPRDSCCRAYGVHTTYTVYATRTYTRWALLPADSSSDSSSSAAELGRRGRMQHSLHPTKTRHSLKHQAHSLTETQITRHPVATRSFHASSASSTRTAPPYARPSAGISRPCGTCSGPQRQRSCSGRASSKLSWIPIRSCCPPFSPGSGPASMRRRPSPCGRRCSQKRALCSAIHWRR